MLEVCVLKPPHIELMGLDINLFTVILSVLLVKGKILYFNYLGLMTKHTDTFVGHFLGEPSFCLISLISNNVCASQSVSVHSTCPNHLNLPFFIKLTGCSLHSSLSFHFHFGLSQ